MCSCVVVAVFSVNRALARSRWLLCAQAGGVGCGQAEEDAAAKAAAELATLKAEIPPEPPAGDGVCTVVVRLQDGR